MNNTKWILVYLTIVLVLSGQTLRAQTAEFTYQGRLLEGSTPANGNYDFEFALFSALSGGTQQGATISMPNVPVTNGVFSVKLNFGSTPFQGANRFLEIKIMHSGNGGVFTTLTPRQQITSAPYSIRSQTTDVANLAGNSLQLGGINANQYVLTTDTRLSDARNPLPNSPSYIQNTTAPQASSDFNISGNGTVGGTLTSNIVTATQYNIGTNRVLSVAGTLNTFVGVGAGAVNTSNSNSFFGNFAGNENTTGRSNSFFGRDAGRNNLTGNDNSFFGLFAGIGNTTGNGNSYFGKEVGTNSTTASNNSFFGLLSGVFTTTGGNNSYFGARSGFENSVGSENTFVGFQAGSENDTGSNNTALGANADMNGGLTFATAIGSGAIVNASNTIQLGRTSGADTVNVSGKLRVVALGGSGSTALCRNASNEISTCSSSLRYKSNVNSFRPGLDLIRRLRPVSFNWKADSTLDFGLVAEEVARVEPLLVTQNEKGETEGVKYDRVGVVLVNAVQEQQTQIEAQARQIKEQSAVISSQEEKLKEQEKSLNQQQSELEKQKAEIDALKRFVCSQNPTAQFCRPKN